MALDQEDVQPFSEIVDLYYEEIREELFGNSALSLIHRQLALLAARGRSLYILIRDLLEKRCENETRILVRPLIEDSIKIMWICDNDASGNLGERLLSFQFMGRLEAYRTLNKISRNQMRKLIEKDKLQEQPWWPQLVNDLLDTAAGLGAAFATTTDPKDVLNIPERWEIYKNYEEKGYDLEAVEPLYVDTCSATHRDGHDLNRYWIQHPGPGRGEILIDRPYDQPERSPGARHVLLFITSTTFLTALAALRSHLGIHTATDAQLEALFKALGEQVAAP